MPNPLIKSQKRFLLYFIFIAFFSLIAVASFIFNGIAIGNDFIQHYQFAVSIHSSIISGEIYPSFVAEVNNGFGDVALRFYPPLTYYVLSIIYLFLGDWYFASILSYFLVFFIGGIGVFLWVNEEFSQTQALIASGIYIFAPYHLNQIYNNFLLAEFFSTAIIPFCFLFLTRVCQKNKSQDFIYLSISYALLILTHLPLTIICSTVFLIYTLILLKRNKMFITIIKLGTSVTFSLLLSSFYWVRMVTEINWIKHSTSYYFSETWSYQKNFLFKPENFIKFNEDALNLWLADLMLLSIILICIPTFFFIFKTKFYSSRYILTIFVVFIFSVFMTTPLSWLVWDNLTFIQKVQFPWRWLGIVSLFGAVLASIGILQFSDIFKTNKSIFLQLGVGIIFVIFVFVSSFIIKGGVYNSRDDLNKQINNLTHSKSFDCWWATWFKSDAFNQTNKVEVKNRSVTIEQWDPITRIFSISSGEAGTVSVATFYYPHWKVKVNGQILETSANQLGLISFDIPSKESNIILYFEEPYFIKIAKWISLFTWLFTAIFCINLYVKQFFNRSNSI